MSLSSMRCKNLNHRTDVRWNDTTWDVIFDVKFDLLRCHVMGWDLICCVNVMQCNVM